MGDEKLEGGGGHENLKLISVAHFFTNSVHLNISNAILSFQTPH